MYYFAYGANMLREVIENRLGSVNDLGICVLDQYRIEFNKIGTDGTGKGNIIKDRSLHVIGVAYELSQKQIEKLDGEERFYDRIKLNIMLNSNLMVAEAYIAQPHKVNDSLSPNETYLGKLINGSIEHNFPHTYIQKLQAVVTEEQRTK